MSKGKKLTQFERGYLCAISNTISGHGCDQSQWDCFLGLGRSLREILSDKSLDEFDLEYLSELKGYDPDYREELKNENQLG